METDERYSVEQGTATDVGNYTATVALRDTVHYAWSDESIEPKTIEWSISKMSVNVPRAILGLIYNGRDQTGINYSAVRQYVTVTNATAKNAGSYESTLELKDKKNTMWADSTDANKTVEWSIRAVPINGAAITLATTSYTYDGKAKEPAVTSVVMKNKGKFTLTAQDYSVNYSSNTNAGTATVTVSGKGNFSGIASKTFTINPKAATPTVTLSPAEYVYNGKVKTPTLKVMVGKTVIGTSGYKATWSSGRKNVGTYSVKVDLKGNYTGTKSASYKIVPKGTTISALKAGSKSLTVKWAKQATQTTGYQVWLATNAGFTKNVKKVNVNKASLTSKAVAGLKKKTKYYVKIRTYKTAGKSTYYSNWSTAKSTKTK